MDVHVGYPVIGNRVFEYADDQPDEIDDSPREDEEGESFIC